MSRSVIVNSCGSIRLRSYPSLTEGMICVNKRVRNLICIRNTKYNVAQERNNLSTNGVTPPVELFVLMSYNQELDVILRANLESIMESNGWTLREAAQVMGIAHTSLGNILRGDRSPKLDTVGQIAKALKVPPARLVTQRI